MLTVVAMQWSAVINNIPAITDMARERFPVFFIQIRPVVQEEQIMK